MRDGLTVLLVAVPVLALGWVCGAMRAETFAAVMAWATLACAAGILLLPQRRMNETFGAARRRVVGAVMCDPFFWTALSLAAVLAIPLFNVALCPVCDQAAIDAGAYPYPPLRGLPFCVNPREHAAALRVIAASLLSALGVRHALIRSGKRAFLELLVWSGAALALLGFVQILGGAPFPYWMDPPPRPPHFFSVFGYSNMGGAFFAMNHAFALGLWSLRMQEREEALDQLAQGQEAKKRHPILATHYPVVAVALSFYAVLATLSRAAISLMAVTTVLFFVYTLIRILTVSGRRRIRRFRMLPAVGAVYLLLCGATVVYAPPEVEREIATLNLFNVADRVSGKGQYHTRVASAIMRDFPLFGVGGWGYRHFCLPYMEDGELRQLQTVGGANVHNDYLQFLVEHGIVGFGLLVSCVALLVLPTIRVWQACARRTIDAARSRLSAPPSIAFIFSPPVLWTLLGCIVVLVHACGDCPLRSGAVLAAFLAALPAVEGHLPHIR